MNRAGLLGHWQDVGNGMKAIWEFRAVRQAIDYALFQGSGRVCAIEIKNAKLEIQRVVLVDRTGQDACPTKPGGLK